MECTLSSQTPHTLTHSPSCCIHIAALLSHTLQLCYPTYALHESVLMTPFLVQNRTVNLYSVYKGNICHLLLRLPITKCDPMEGKKWWLSTTFTSHSMGKFKVKVAIIAIGLSFKVGAFGLTQHARAADNPFGLA